MNSSIRKTICIDARMIKNSGIGLYIEKYTQYILESNKWYAYIIGSKSTLSNLYGNFKNWTLIEDDSPIYSIREQFMLFKKIPRCDILWSPHYNIPLLYVNAKKRVVTIPDIFHLVSKSTYSFEKRIYAEYVLKNAVKKSDIVTTISTFSRGEILEKVCSDPQKVIAIPLGVDSNYFNPNSSLLHENKVIQNYSLPDKYLLFVGNVKPHKNLLNLLKAFQKIAISQKDVHVLIVGKKEGFITGDKEVFKFLNENADISKRVLFTGYVKSEDLPIIYKLASLFVFPSLYEGFGLPPLEAMACGCPVVASNAASIPETCGDAAYYIDPTNIDSIAEGILDVLGNSTTYNNLIKKGYKRVKLYKWHESAAIFEDILFKL
ncbi:glycosyltransferase family 1 protein [Spirosoma sp. SC4-14]|uniref:glycosyltransferase family 4 protein n=1 Tax=Spirosoma sp. SC4-14 TaxID=3128900 RepID=UPI0030CCD88D